MAEGLSYLQTYVSNAPFLEQTRAVFKQWRHKGSYINFRVISSHGCPAASAARG